MQQTPTATFSGLVDLAAERLGGRALACNDDFFAEKENLVKPGRGVFIPDKYTDRGKWMDGWESRRRREAGHDWCVVRLGAPGVIRGLDIDTNHFLGNHPPFAAVDAASVALGDDASAAAVDAPIESLQWKEVLTQSQLLPGSQNLFSVGDPGRFTHVRLRIYPDGGVARLRVYGEPRPDWSAVPHDSAGRVNLAAVEHGALVVSCSDMFFGPMQNLLMPGRGVNMGDGWETRRRRQPGNEWVVVRLAAAGSVEHVEVDTAHFKGNYPDRCTLEAVHAPGATPSELSPGALAPPAVDWKPVLPAQKLKADTQHYYTQELSGGAGPWTHVRLSIYPDGGVSRLRVWGRPAK